MPILYLVRHGQAGRLDENYDQLSPLGASQAAALAEYFNQRELNFAVAYSGTLERQRKTRDILVEHLTNPPPVCEESSSLNEIPFEELMKAYCEENSKSSLVSRLLGATQNDRVALYFRVLRQAIGRWQAGELAGEFMTWERFSGDLVDWGEALRQSDPGGDILAVSSGGTIATLLAHIMKAPGETMVELNFQIRNTAYCEVAFNAKRMRVISFNNVDHIGAGQRKHLLTSL